MALNEADTKEKLIVPELHSKGWTENLIRREETVGAMEIVGGIPRQRASGMNSGRVMRQVRVSAWIRSLPNPS